MKTIPIDNAIITPKGILKCDNINENDVIYTHNGDLQRIFNIKEIEEECYLLQFSDNTNIEIGNSDIYTLSMYDKKNNKQYKYRNIVDIKNNFKNKENKCLYRINICKNIEYNNHIEIHPYIIGCLIGDGHIGYGVIDFCNNDIDIINRIKKILPNNFDCKYKKGYNYSITNNNIKNNLLKQELIKYNIYGKKSYNKYISNDLLLLSFNDRLEILKGLIDTDGCITERQNNTCRIQYFTISDDLAFSVVNLVNSLGGTAIINKRYFSDKDNHYYNGKLIRHNYPLNTVGISIPINPCFCERKAKKYQPMNPKRLITNIDKINKKKCISFNTTTGECITNNYTCI